jgi:hypothetical protein
VRVEGLDRHDRYVLHHLAPGKPATRGESV